MIELQVFLSADLSFIVKPALVAKICDHVPSLLLEMTQGQMIVLTLLTVIFNKKMQNFLGKKIIHFLSFISVVKQSHHS